MKIQTIRPSVPLVPQIAVGSLVYLGQPVLMAGAIGAIAWALAAGAPLGLVSLLILFGAIGYLVVLERVIPFKDEWQPSAKEWRRDGIYFGINGGMSALIGGMVGVGAIWLARDTTGLPLAAELPLGVLLVGFVGYWTHRLGHELSGLWLLHGVHHAPTKVNAWNNNVIHFADLMFQNASSLGALVLLGFSPEAVFAITAFTQVMGFVDHANADFRMGWLNYVIGSPEQHRLHHSTDLEEAGHYSFLPLWDMVFGTFTWKPYRTPKTIGIVEPESFPSPDSIACNAVHPVRALMQRG